jgi:hypothetical protein
MAVGSGERYNSNSVSPADLCNERRLTTIVKWNDNNQVSGRELRSQGYRAQHWRNSVNPRGYQQCSWHSVSRLVSLSELTVSLDMLLTLYSMCGSLFADTPQLRAKPGLEADQIWRWTGGALRDD